FPRGAAPSGPSSSVLAVGPLDPRDDRARQAAEQDDEPDHLVAETDQDPARDETRDEDAEPEESAHLPAEPTRSSPKGRLQPVHDFVRVTLRTAGSAWEPDPVSA